MFNVFLTRDAQKGTSAPHPLLTHALSSFTTRSAGYDFPIARGCAAALPRGLKACVCPCL